MEARTGTEAAQRVYRYPASQREANPRAIPGPRASTPVGGLANRYKVVRENREGSCPANTLKHPHQMPLPVSGSAQVSWQTAVCPGLSAVVLYTWLTPTCLSVAEQGGSGQTAEVDPGLNPYSSDSCVTRCEIPTKTCAETPSVCQSSPEVCNGLAPTSDDIRVAHARCSRPGCRAGIHGSRGTFNFRQACRTHPVCLPIKPGVSSATSTAGTGRPPPIEKPGVGCPPVCHTGFDSGKRYSRVGQLFVATGQARPRNVS